MHETYDDWEFGVSNYNSGKNKDIYCICKRKDTLKHTEVHVLNGSNNYQSWSQQTTTKLHETDNKFDFYPVNRQLFVISKNGASGSTEIHALKV